MNTPIYVPMTAAAVTEGIPMTVSAAGEALSMLMGVSINAGTSPVYGGPYEITPSAEEQHVPIRGMAAARDIVIHPIPSNYGLVTWNGSVLTVS